MIEEMFDVYAVWIRWSVDEGKASNGGVWVGSRRREIVPGNAVSCQNVRAVMPLFECLVAAAAAC